MGRGRGGLLSLREREGETLSSDRTPLEQRPHPLWQQAPAPRQSLTPDGPRRRWGGGAGAGGRRALGHRSPLLCGLVCGLGVGGPAFKGNRPSTAQVATSRGGSRVWP